jgi:hypothetical protein
MNPVEMDTWRGEDIVSWESGCLNVIPYVSVYLIRNKITLAPDSQVHSVATATCP